MTNSLRISCTAFWSYPPHSPNSSQIPLFIPHPPNFVPSFLRIHWIRSVPPKYSWVSGRSLKQGWPCRGHIHLQKLVSPLTEAPSDQCTKNQETARCSALHGTATSHPFLSSSTQWIIVGKGQKLWEPEVVGDCNTQPFPVTAGHLHGPIAVMECMLRSDKIPS